MEENKDFKKVEETENKVTHGETSLDIKAILENEDFQKYLQSFSDKRVSEAVRTNEKKLKQKFDEEKKKSEMTQEELLQQKENELKDRELKLEKIQYFKEKQYDLDLLDFVFGEDIEAVKEKADLLVTNINKVVEKQVNERLKSGYIPTKSDENKSNNSGSIGLKLAKQVDENQKKFLESQNQYFK